MAQTSTPKPSVSLATRVGSFLREYYIYLVLVAVVVVLSVANLDKFGLFERGNFLNQNNIINVLRVSAPLLTLAGAFTLLMVSGKIDLSVGSAMGLYIAGNACGGMSGRILTAWLAEMMTWRAAVIGIGLLIWLCFPAWKGRFNEDYHNPVEVVGLYWHFVDIIWIFLFPLLYLIGFHMHGH